MKTKFSALALATLALLGVASCQEDNIAEQVRLTNNGQSLWANINNSSNIDSFAMILKNTYFLTSDYDKSLNYTYDQVLNTTQQYSVFAPVNGSYNAQAILTQLDEAKALIATNRDSARLIYRRVEKEFVRNHVARYNVGATTTATQVSLLNGKTATYVPATTFNGVALVGDGIGGNNGELRFMQGQSPFRYNLYEFIRNNAANSDYANYLLPYDTTYFSEATSVPGALFEGQIQYIDSVYVQYNKVLSENLRNEDSTFVGLVPTNEAAADFYTRFLPYIQYRDTYKTTWVVNAQTGNGAFSRTDTIKVDSLRQAQARNQMSSFFAFSTRQMQVTDPNDEAQVREYVLKADSLNPRFSDGFLNNLTPGQPNAVFAGYTPERLSNGWVYSVDQFNLMPKHWLVDLSYDMVDRSHMILNDNQGQIRYSVVNIDSTTADSTIELIDSISDGDYMQFVLPRRGLNLELRLHNNIYSNTPYKIGLVTVPSKAHLDMEQRTNPSPVFQARIFDDRYEAAGRNTGLVKFESSKRFTVDTTKVDTLWLYDDVVFPHAYSGVGVFSYPRLVITSFTANNSLLNIDAIIMRPKELDN